MKQITNKEYDEWQKYKEEKANRKEILAKEKKKAKAEKAALIAVVAVIAVLVVGAGVLLVTKKRMEG